MADGDARTELFRLAVRKIVEEALEAEVSDVLGRGYYESGAEPGRGYRNGYRRGRLRTAEGAIEYGVPQVADRAEPFVSRIRAGLAGRTAELERLAVTASWLPTMAHRPWSWIGLIHESSAPANYATATAKRVSVSSASRPPRSKRAIWSRTSCSNVPRTSAAKPT